MEDINIRQGESLDLAVQTDDLNASTATLIVGNVGETPQINVTITLLAGIGQFALTPEETSVAVGTYRYQMNILHSDGQVEKYPEPEDCDDDGLPKFIVHETLGA